MTNISYNPFVFNEIQDVTFSLTLYDIQDDKRVSHCINCVIKLDENGELSLLTNDFESVKSVDLCKQYEKKDYSIKNAKIGNIETKLCINQPIKFTSFKTRGTKHTCSMRLNSFSYSIASGMESDIVYRLSASSSFIEGYLSQFVVDGSTVVGIAPSDYNFLLAGQVFHLFRDDKHIYLKAKSEKNIDLFLALSSMFSCNPIDVDMKYYEGKVNVHTPHYLLPYVKKNNNILCYLFCNNVCLDYYTDFLDFFGEMSIENIKDEIILYIDNYVRAEYLDEIAKLTLYTSILEKMANTQIGEDSWKCVKQFLEYQHFDCSKINRGLNRIHDSEKKSIDNFVNLRNFFVHHLGNKEAKDFLENSDLLFFLKSTITIIILNKLGLDSIRFDKCFHNLSVYDHTIEEADHISKLLNMNKSDS